MSKLIGIGKVQNGRIMFSTVEGKGFSRPVSSPAIEVKPVVRTAPAIKPNPVYMVEELDVPEFMKNRKPAPKGEVIEVDFGGEKKSEPELIMDELIVAGKWVLKPLKNFFFGKDEE